MFRRSSVIFAASLALLSTLDSATCFAAAAPAQPREDLERPRFLKKEIKRFVFTNTTTTSGGGSPGEASTSDLEALHDALTSSSSQDLGADATLTSATTIITSTPSVTPSDNEQSSSSDVSLSLAGENDRVKAFLNQQPSTTTTSVSSASPRSSSPNNGDGATTQSSIVPGGDSNGATGSSQSSPSSSASHSGQSNENAFVSQTTSSSAVEAAGNGVTSQLGATSHPETSASPSIAALQGQGTSSLGSQTNTQVQPDKTQGADALHSSLSSEGAENSPATTSVAGTPSLALAAGETIKSTSNDEAGRLAGAVTTTSPVASSAGDINDQSPSGGEATSETPVTNTKTDNEGSANTNTNVNNFISTTLGGGTGAATTQAAQPASSPVAPQSVAVVATGTKSGSEASQVTVGSGDTQPTSTPGAGSISQNGGLLEPSTSIALQPNPVHVNSQVDKSPSQTTLADGKVVPNTAQSPEAATSSENLNPGVTEAASVPNPSLAAAASSLNAIPASIENPLASVSGNAPLVANPALTSAASVLDALPASIQNPEHLVSLAGSPVSASPVSAGGSNSPEGSPQNTAGATGSPNGVSASPEVSASPVGASAASPNGASAVSPVGASAASAVGASAASAVGASAAPPVGASAVSAVGASAASAVGASAASPVGASAVSAVGASAASAVGASAASPVGASAVSAVGASAASLVEASAASAVGASAASAVGASAASPVGASAASAVEASAASPVGASAASAVGASAASPVGASAASAVEASAASPVGASAASAVGASAVSAVGASAASAVGASAVSPVEASAVSPVGASASSGASAASPVEASSVSPVEASAASPVDTSVTSPVGASASPGASAASPVGASASLGASAASPNGASAASSVGASASPGASAASPVGASASLGASAASPNGASAASLVGASASPGASAASPVGASASPNGASAASPVGASASPGGASASPVEGTVSPVGASGSPVGVSASPAESGIAGYSTQSNGNIVPISAAAGTGSTVSNGHIVPIATGYEASAQSPVPNETGAAAASNALQSAAAVAASNAGQSAAAVAAGATQNNAASGPTATPVVAPHQHFAGKGPYTQSPTGYDTSTTQLVPTSIIHGPSSMPSATSFGPSTLPSNVPQILYQNGGPGSQPANTRLINIAFRYPLNYLFVYNHTISQQQIFHYIPLGICYGLEIEVTAITMQSLRAWNTYEDVGFVTTLALAWVPEGLVDNLALLVSTSVSRFYRNPDNSTAFLLSMIDNAIPITGSNGTDGASTPFGNIPTDTSSAKTAGAPIGGDIGNSEHVRASSVGIGVGVACGAAAYGAAMFFVARRYKKRRQSHLRSPSMFSSPVMSHAGPDAGAGAALMSGAMGERSASPYYDNDGRAGSRGSGRSGSSRHQISAPVMAENSLGWN